MFASADEAFASNEKAANWVRNNVLESTRGMPEVMTGHVLIAETKSAEVAQGEGAARSTVLA
jgi:hypothetical protein